MNKKSFPKKVQKWCDDRGWTDLFLKEGVFYAFPPKAVIPLPVPVKVINYGYLIISIFILGSIVPLSLLFSVAAGATSGGTLSGVIFTSEIHYFGIKSFLSITGSIPSEVLISLLLVINIIGGLWLFIKLGRIMFISERTDNAINEVIPLFAVFSLLAVTDNWLIFLFLT